MIATTCYQKETLMILLMHSLQDPDEHATDPTHLINASVIWQADFSGADGKAGFSF